MVIRQELVRTMEHGLELLQLVNVSTFIPFYCSLEVHFGISVVPSINLKSVSSYISPCTNS